MFLCVRLFLLACLTCLSMTVYAAISPDGIWTDLSAKGIKKDYQYRSIRADLSSIKNRLRHAPVYGGTSSGIEFYLPHHQSGHIRLRVFSDSIMEKALSDKYPELKTYYVQGIDNPYISGRMDVTPDGLHAFIQTDKGRLIIEPEKSYMDNQHSSLYRSFKKDDFPVKTKERYCRLHGKHNTKLFNPTYKYSRSLYRSAGQKIRTYRIAVATTGEYSTAVSSGAPTKAKVMAALVTAINRVNEVYQRDLSIKFKLVANNDKIIFLDAAKDGFTNDDGEALIGESVSKINAIIGSANYDIGHVFSTGGGGLAGFGVVCSASKAEGITGSPNPVGDPFVIDYVAHEIGHQFMAAHTFNASNSGSCDAGNRSAGSAYEPGSGTTIMSYAGICSDQNIQSNSNAYFHAKSLDAIRAFVEDAKAGGACGSVQSIVNILPTANAGQDYIIPSRTPFVLSATGGDADAQDVSSLTYTWEQYDLGKGSATVEEMKKDRGDGPLFRSFEGSNNPKRTFPALGAILKNDLTSSLGEVLPSTDRALNFRLTVRSGAAGRSAFSQDDAKLTVKASAGPFDVIQPGAGTAFLPGAKQQVQWNVANTDKAPISCSHVAIKYSGDGGKNFKTTLLASTANDGAAEVTMPSSESSEARVKVECLNNIFFDINPGNFAVNKAASSSQPTLTIEAITASQKEGSDKNTVFNFRVKRTGNASVRSEVNYKVVAVAGDSVDKNDFVTGIIPSGKVILAIGETAKNISISVQSDDKAEKDEAFKVVLSAPLNAVLGSKKDASAVIVNDDSSNVIQPSQSNASSNTTTSVTPSTASTSSGGGGSTGYLFSFFMLFLMGLKVFRKYIVLPAATLMFATLGACQTYAEPEVSQYTDGLLWVKTADAHREAELALVSGDLQLWAYSNRAGLVIPGFGKAEHQRLLSTYGIRKPSSMGDVIYGKEHRELRRSFIEYAAKYNSYIVNSWERRLVQQGE